jgi:hypothetical protein
VLGGWFFRLLALERHGRTDNTAPVAVALYRNLLTLAGRDGRDESTDPLRNRDRPPGGGWAGDRI